MNQKWQYITDFGNVGISKGTYELLERAKSRLPSWFNRIYRPKFYRLQREAFHTEKWIQAIAAYAFRDGDDLPDFIRTPQDLLSRAQLEMDIARANPSEAPFSDSIGKAIN